MSGFALDVKAHAVRSFRFDLKVGCNDSILAGVTVILREEPMDCTG